AALSCHQAVTCRHETYSASFKNGSRIAQARSGFKLCAICAARLGAPREGFELGVSLRKHDLDMGIEVAVTARREGQTLALETQLAVRTRPCRHRHCEAAMRGFDRHLATENGIS